MIYAHAAIGPEGGTAISPRTLLQETNGSSRVLLQSLEL